MKASLKCISAALLVLFGFALLSASVYAQEEEGKTFVYTNNNNNPAARPNSVSAFSVLPGGALSPPTVVPTGGMGTGDGFRALTRITATIARNFLYASNDGSDNISAFSINPATGGLAAIGLPVATGSGAGSGANGISLAVTPNGKFLYAASLNSSDIRVFSIGPGGGLTAKPLLAVSAGGNPDGIKVSPDGKFLAVALPFTGVGGSVAMFSINASTGALTLEGSFAQGDPLGNPGTTATEVDINCKSNLLFAAHANATSTVVSVATINPVNGALLAIGGSPFNLASGSNSNVGVLSPDNRHLFVSNQFSNTITSLDVAPGPSPPAGSLTLETPSPFSDSPGMDPIGMVTNREGTLLYVANRFNNEVTGFHIADGVLTALSPVNFFSTNSLGGFPAALTLFPSKAIEGEGKIKDEKGHEDDFNFEAEHECEARGEMEFKDRETGEEMHGSVDAVRVSGSQATMSGSGTRADGTHVNYTAAVLGNAPVVGVNLFAISWITDSGSVFQTSGALTGGYIAVH